MKVKLRTIYASPTGTTGHPGTVLDLDPPKAKALLAGGYAELVKLESVLPVAVPVVETATAEPDAETAELPRPRGRPRKNPLV